MKKRFQKFDGLIHTVLDICSLLVAGFLSESLSHGGSLYRFAGSPLETIHASAIYVFIAYIFDLYYPLRDFRSYRSIVRLMVAVGVFALIIVMIDALRTTIGHPSYSGSGQFIGFLLLLFAFSYSARLVMSFLRKQVFVRNAIIIGDTKTARLLMECITEEQRTGRSLGFSVVGYVADDATHAPHNSLSHLGKLSEIATVRERKDVSLMIYALDSFENPEINELIVHERLRGIPLISAVGLYEAITGRIPHGYVNAAWLIEECLRSNRFTQVNMKNLMDRALGVFLLLLSVPVLAICAYLVKRESPGPAFFTQQRIGKFGKPFTIYKFRTMRPAEEAGSAVAEGWHQQQEARITNLGRLLRRTHLDELPQLFNVVLGDMSLVGPRPEMEIFIRACEHEIPFYRLRLDVKPGLTGWAQVAFRHTSNLDAYREKFEYELYYLSHLSLQFDLEILARTLFVVFFKPSR